MKHVDVARYSQVLRPEWTYRDFIEAQIKKADYDILKEDNRDKLKKLIRYTCPQGIAHVSNLKQIPQVDITDHMRDYEDYPKLHEDKMRGFDKNQDQTFTTTKRFADE